MTDTNAGAVIDESDLARYKRALLASPSRSRARPSGAFWRGILALAALVLSPLACGKSLELIFDPDAGPNAALGGTGGLPNIVVGAAGTFGSAGVAGTAGSGGAAGMGGGGAGSGGAPLLDASVAQDAAADAADAAQ
jgi:hypothetical protein